MRITRLLLEIALLAWVAFCLPQCGQGIVQACSDDRDCSEGPKLFCDLSVHQCIAHPCTPDCTGRECGPDPQNCGTSCGTCELANPECNQTTGRCESCSPDCGGRVCGPVPNGCGESCGTCTDTEVCNTAAGSCETCTPDCGNRVCGSVPNGCGESCGSCEDTKPCNIASGQCEGCAPDCGARVCGPVPNDCGESCGKCEDPESCDIANGRCRAARGEPIFDGSFQLGDHWVSTNYFYAQNYQPGTYNACLVRSDSLIVEPAPGGRAGFAGKFTIKAGDHCNAEVDRAMLGYEHYKIFDGEDRWYSVSSYFPPGFSTSTWFMFWQIKTMDGGYPSVALYANPGKWALRWDEVNNESIGTFSTGWTDWLVHVKWTTDDTGLIEVFRNGEMEFYRYDVRMIPLRANPKDWNTRCLVVSSTCKPVSPDYSLSMGAYRGNENPTLVDYIYNIKIGNTRADVEY